MSQSLAQLYVRLIFGTHNRDVLLEESFRDEMHKFSVSQSGVGAVIDYIEKQEEHHRHKTFQEEYVEFLEKYKVKYDPKYLWNE